MTFKRKPMLACDWYQDRVKFPLTAQPKVDGVRSLNQNGQLIGRSLKKHENIHITKMYSRKEFHGFDGEMILGDDPGHPDLCRLSSQALRTRNGEPVVTWFIFDFVREETLHLSYEMRMNALNEYLRVNPWMEEQYNIVPISSITILDMDELLELEQKYLSVGLEGMILRDPKALHKDGRCGKTFMGCWRIKRFIEVKARVKSIEEGRKNNNAAKVNELGRTERSSHAENMEPNGQVGALICELLEPICDLFTNEVLIEAGEEIRVSAGEMTEAEAIHFFNHPEEILEHIIKFRTFPKGVKDKPRFPNYVTIVNENDN